MQGAQEEATSVKAELQLQVQREKAAAQGQSVAAQNAQAYVRLRLDRVRETLKTSITSAEQDLEKVSKQLALVCKDSATEQAKSTNLQAKLAAADAKCLE
eukprot:1432581-Pleurochrysis_carterae.AAC.1